ncbi:MAG: PDR/VanB family oxidoreductase [Hyphomicrobium sp.]|jgi:ferredoxin-NADP reductase
MTASALRRVRVAEVEDVAEAIKRFRLVDVAGSPLPTFSAGSHVVVTMHDGKGRVWKNPYSLIRPPSDPNGYEISVLRCATSRGGSAYMHEHVAPGAELEISDPVNLFPVVGLGRKHILVAGGIGITPFLAIMKELAARGADFELHYKVRSLARGAFCNDLRQQYGERVHIYRSDQGEALPLQTILGRQPLGTHMYVCGPAAMIDWALQVGRDAGWPVENLHSEKFTAPPPGHAFTVKLARSHRDIIVGPQQSILEALEQNGVDAPCLCRGGACGQCETRVLSCEEGLQHNDHYLTEEEKASGEKVMICVSRARGGSLTLDL